MIPITSEELARYLADSIVAVQGRILGVGKEQYDEGSQQKFELMSIKELIQYAIEEVEDGIAYNVMLRYKLTLLLKAWAAANDGYAANTQAQRDRPVTVTFGGEPTPIGDQVAADIRHIIGVTR